MKKTEGQITLSGKTYKAVQWDYNSYVTESGSITLAGVTSSAIQKIGVESEIYSISVTTTNIEAAEGNPAIIEEGSTATLSFKADNGYIVPQEMPTITGATGEYNRLDDTECEITLSDPTTNVEFTIVGEPA